jgi:selenocysteine lyase/cysteine desulfurase
MDWDAWLDEVRLAKQEFATLINASPDEIAVFSSVSEATSAVASALDFSAKRNKIVVSAAEFPTVGQIWLAQEHRGARVGWVPVRDGKIESVAYDALVDDETVIVSACHGYYLNGFMQDIPALATRAHAHGAMLFVDAYQTIGAIPVDVRALGVDFLASGNLKFLMGMPGVAFLYVRSDLIPELHPTVTGWFGRRDPFSFQTQTLDWSPTASRFDAGTPPLVNVYVARAGMQIINEVGPVAIRKWLEHLSARLIEGGRSRGLTIDGTTDIARRTSTTAFRVADSHAVEVAMRANGVIASARGPVIRLAPHFYNTVDDVDRALDALVAAVR